MTPDGANTIFRQYSLEKRPKCQEQLEVFKAMKLQACAAIVIIKKVLMTDFDVTRK